VRTPESTIEMGGSQNFVHGINREKYRGTRYTAVLCFVIVANEKHNNFELIILYRTIGSILLFLFIIYYLLFSYYLYLLQV